MIEFKRNQLSRYDYEKIMITNVSDELVNEIYKMFRFQFKVGLLRTSNKETRNNRKKVLTV